MPAGDEPGRPPLPSDLVRLLHDVRGPLNSLTMHLEVLKRSALADPVAEDSLRIVQEQVARLTEMLPAAFAVVALEPRAFRPVDLGEVMEAARDQAGGPVTLANTAWPTVVGDAALLTVAMAHLLRNAVEASPAGVPWPMASAKVVGEEARIEVRDWGRGLSVTNPRLLIRLMHSSKAGHRGIGLVSVERIARLHRGSVAFASPEDGGAVVTLSLPCAA